MTVSMRLMSAGDGYRYLLKTVAAGDGERDLSTPWESKRTYALREAGTSDGTTSSNGRRSAAGGVVRPDQ